MCHINGICCILHSSFTSFPKFSMGDISFYIWTHDQSVSAAESPEVPLVRVSPISSRCGIMGGPW